MKLFILLVILIVSCWYYLAPTFGTRPDPAEKEKFFKSPQYDKTQQIFANRRPNLVKEMRKKIFTYGLFKEWLSSQVERSPLSPLPQVKPDVISFINSSADMKVIWLGHSTFLINMNGKIILVDPVFSGSASPVSFLVKRFQPPALDLHELPGIDYVVISHDHYDHLDRESIEFFKDRDAMFLAPLGVGSYLRGWGIPAVRVKELDWWQSFKTIDLEFTATPAQHFSGRDGLHDNETLWASWVIRSPTHKIYFSGDSGYDTHFKEIGDKFGPFDIAFLESGQYNERWKVVHMLPEEAVQAYHDLQAKRFFPVHWGMFVLALHSWDEPILKLQAAAETKGINLISPKLGQIVEVNDNYKNEFWWNRK